MKQNLSKYTSWSDNETKRNCILQFERIMPDTKKPFFSGDKTSPQNMYSKPQIHTKFMYEKLCSMARKQVVEKREKKLHC